MLTVGELDTNVDPSSTMQVVNALIRANKTFDMLVMPGEDHPAGRRGASAPYGDRKLWDFFIHNLMGVETPNWNSVDAAKTRVGSTSSGLFDPAGPTWDQVWAGWQAGQP